MTTFDIYDEVNRLSDIEDAEKLTEKEVADLFTYFNDTEKLPSVEKALTKSKNDKIKLTFLRNLLTAEQPISGHIRARSPNEDSVMIKQKKRMKEYHETVSIGFKANSPSVGANPENFFKNQQVNPILNSRPLANTGSPITLYNDAFSIFLNDFNDKNLKVPPDFLKWADRLILEATNSYGNEEERNEKMRELLSIKLGTILLVEYGKKRQKCKSDGVITTNIGSLIAYLGILEGKNEIGTGKNDPTIQGALYYRDYWSQDNVKKIRDCCCAPSFIIIVAGPWFCILGGVFLTKAVVEPLTDLIPATINLRAFDKQKRIARLFYSLHRALLHLDQFYQNLDLRKSVDLRFFPYVRQYQSDGNNTTSFTYVCELSDDPTRTIWKGILEDGITWVVIKFTSKYCVDAHIICANAGFAPGLLYCSNKAEAKRFGGFRMIIMQYIEGTTLDKQFHEDTVDDASYGLVIYKDVKCAIDELHNENFVFADLRSPNIMTFRTGQEIHANLIDFDWCGKHGVDRYPSSLNEDIVWPPEVEPEVLLRKDHDLYWLDVLRKFFGLHEDEVTDEALDFI